MIEAFATQDVYAAESTLMQTLAEGELMARAVEGLIEVVSARIEQLGAQRVVALVGTGNNGADALYAVAGLALTGVNCAALHLSGKVHPGAYAAAEAAGVVLLAADENLTIGDFSWGEVEPGRADKTSPIVQFLSEADIVLDGILGIGGRGGLPRWGATWVAAVPDTAYVIAVDVPSGQDPNGGALSADGVFADETVTFSVAKPAHLLPPTEAAAGTLTFVDIGLLPSAEPSVRRLTRDDVADLWPVPTAADDKYSRGVLGVVAGSERYAGAAVLAVTSAVEAGIGMVRYIGPATPTGLVRQAVPEAVIGAGQVQAWVAGPGVDPDEATEAGRAQRQAVVDVLDAPEPVVLDAGALDLVDDSVALRRAGRTTVLTPHAGECARLLTRLTSQEVTNSEVSADPVSAARRLAEVTGATVLLKGSTTIVVGPEGPVRSQADGPAWLATAGAGDVLAGVIGVLLAQGLDGPVAAALGSLVHSVAADDASGGGPLRARRVAQALPSTIADLLNRGRPTVV